MPAKQPAKVVTENYAIAIWMMSGITTDTMKASGYAVGTITELNIAKTKIINVAECLDERRFLHIRNKISLLR